MLLKTRHIWILGVVCVAGLISYWLFQPKEVATLSDDPSFEYSLAVKGKKIRSFRSPAAIKKALAEKKTSEKLSTTLDKPEVKNVTQANSKVNESIGNQKFSDHAIAYNNRDKNNHYIPEKVLNPADSKKSSQEKKPVLGAGLPQTADPVVPKSPEYRDRSDDKTPTIKDPVITGKIKPLEGIVLSSNRSFLISGAYAATTCTDPRIKLFDLTNMSVLLDNALTEAQIHKNVDFSFNPVELKLNLDDPTRYLLQTSGCDVTYQRLITSFYEDQNLDQVTTLISKVINTRLAVTLEKTKAYSIEKLYNEVLKKVSSSDTFDSVYTKMSSDPVINEAFKATFTGGTTDELEVAAPDIEKVTYHNLLKEKETYSYDVRAFHWNAGYQTGYEWKINGSTVSTSASWQYTPTANSPKAQVITLLVGSRKVDGTVDPDFPYHEINFDVSIDDTYPVEAPQLALNASFSNPTSTKTIDLDLATGALVNGSYEGCETFKEFAITESSSKPLDSAFTYTCDNGPVDTFSYTIQSADGDVSLHVWARDTEGRISPVPHLLNINVDSTAPIIAFTSINSGYRADEAHTFSWLLTEAHSVNSQKFKVEFYNGSTWSLEAPVSVTNGPHENSLFTTAIQLPNTNISAAKLRITYADTLGLETIIESPAFKVMSPILASDTTPLDMGTQPNTSTSLPYVISFKNNGEVDSRVCGNVVLSGTHASEFNIVSDNCGSSTLSSGESCQINLTATPTDKGTRNASATLACGPDSFTVPISIISTNNAGILASQNLTTPEDTGLSVTLGPVRDSDNDLLTYTIVAAPAHGTVSGCSTVSDNYICSFQPASNYNGSDVFTFKANDGTTDSNTASINLTITPVNDAPTIAGPQSLILNEDEPKAFTLNPGSDIENNTLTYIIVTQPSNGVLSCAGGVDPSCTYTPDTDYNGSDSFTYKVNDGALDSNILTVTIDVLPKNDPPLVGASQNIVTNEDTNLSFTLNNGSDIDLPIQTLSYKLVSSPSNGTLSNCITTGAYSTDLSCDYAPNLNFFGTDSFTYKVYDGVEDSVTVATVTITVNSVNDAPTLVASQTVTTAEDTVLNFSLNTGADVDNATLNYIIDTYPSSGTLVCTQGTSTACTYSPATDFTGAVTFTYKVSDGMLNSTVATVTINVTNENDPPVMGANQAFTTNEDTPFSFTLNSASDVDVPAQTLSYKLITLPTKGTLSNCITNGGYGTDLSCDYTPLPNTNGTDTFTFRANDGISDSSGVETVTITITPVNDAPTLAASQNVSTNEDTPLTFNLTAGSDVDNDTLSFVKVTNTSNGTITCTGGGSSSCTYTPNLNFNGTDSFTYKVSDGLLDSTIATVTIQVTGVNDAPTLAATQAISTDEDTPITFSLNAGSDTEGDVLTYIKLTNPANGTLTCSGGTSRSCTYTPALNFNGTNTFTYQVNDGSLNSNIATVTITVNPVNDAPTLAATQAVGTNEDTAVTFNLTAGSDVEGSTLTYIKLTNTTNGSIACDGSTSRSCTYVPDLNFNGTDSFTYRVSDGSLNSTTATVTITVNGINDAPVVAANQTFSTNDATSLAFTINPATDVDGDALSYKIITPPANGTVSNCITSAGYGTDLTCNYISNINFHGTDSFTYVAYDGALNSVTTGTITFNVTDTTPSLAPTLTRVSPQYTKVTTNTFTASTCTDTPWILINESTKPAAGAAGWQACSTSAGAISYTLASATEGPHTLKAWSKDAQGNVSTTSTDFIIYYDITAPVLAVTNPPNLRGGSSVTLNWTLTETYSSSAQTMSVEYFNGSTWSSVGTTNATNGPLSSAAFSRSWTVPLLNISNAQIRVLYTDLAGNSATQVSAAFAIDSTAPSLTNTSPSQGSFVQPSATFAGACEPSSVITFSGSIMESFNVTCTAGGTYSNLVNFSSGDGAKAIVITATDAVGNTTSITRNVTVDTLAPILTRTTGANPQYTNTSTVTWGGTCDQNYTITVTGAASQTFACSNGSWSWTTPSKATQGTFTYNLVQTDGAGNTSTPLALTWTRDTTPPSFTIAQATPYKSNESTISLSGTCDSTLPISISGHATEVFSCMNGAWTWSSPSFTTDGTYTFNFSHSDEVGNATVKSFVWTRDTTGPVLTIASKTEIINNLSTATYSGTCDQNYTVNITGGETTSVPCSSGSWTWTTSIQTTDALRTYTIAQTNALSNTTSHNVKWLRETDRPSITSFSTTASNPSKVNFVPVSLMAGSANPAVNIIEFCLRSNVSTQPEASNFCWTKVNAPQVGLSPAATLNLSDFSFLLGWEPATYNIYAWVKDAAGNISLQASSPSVDMFTLIYDPAIPPKIWDVIAANSDTTANPPSRAESTVPAGSDVFVRWKVSDTDDPLPANAISLYYTQDEINFTPITDAQGLAPNHNNCPSLSPAANEGCFRWVGGSPLSTSYKIRVKVTDVDSLDVQSISNPLNNMNIRILAGNTESGLGGSGASAIFYTRENGSEADAGSLVVSDDGNIYVADYKRGILTVDPSDGKQKVFIPLTGSSTGDGGAASNATLKYPTKITLDYNNRLLILDVDRIRRVNLSANPPTIETIIGGGTDTADITDPLSVKITAHSTNSWVARGTVFFAMPNGDIYFESDTSGNKDYNDPTMRIRVFKNATKKIESLYVTGTGTAYNPSVDITKCRLNSLGVEFDPATSKIKWGTLQAFHSESYPDCPANGTPGSYVYTRAWVNNTLTAKPPLNNTLNYIYHFHRQGMDGKLYIFYYNIWLNRINENGSHTRILGSSATGTCPDGTLASSCNMNLRDAFITTSGKVYFLDGGSIRTLDDNNKVITISGQKRSYGDGVNALNARFENIENIDLKSDGKIVTSDAYYLKEFTVEGNINVIAGNGNSQSMPTGVDAKTVGMHEMKWWSMDPATGDIYAAYSYDRLYKLNRSTNMWEPSIGGGTIDYWNADGLPGSSNKNGSTQNYLLPVGFGNGKVVVHRMKINNDEGHYEDFMLKLHDINDSMKQYHLAGTSDPALTYVGGYESICASGTAAASCKIPYYTYSGLVSYDPNNSRWLMVQVLGSTTTRGRSIYSMKEGGTVDLVTTLPRTLTNSYTYAKIGTKEYLFYCASGKIYRHNLTSNTDEGQLPWSISNLACSGIKLIYSPTMNALIFPFMQNGMSGVAAYYTPAP
jgi:VCBS repeat-containing protein